MNTLLCLMFLLCDDKGPEFSSVSGKHTVILEGLVCDASANEGRAFAEVRGACQRPGHMLAKVKTRCAVGGLKADGQGGACDVATGDAIYRFRKTGREVTFTVQSPDVVHAMNCHDFYERRYTDDRDVCERFAK